MRGPFFYVIDGSENLPHDGYMETENTAVMEHGRKIGVEAFLDEVDRSSETALALKGLEIIIKDEFVRGGPSGLEIRGIKHAWAVRRSHEPQATKGYEYQFAILGVNGKRVEEGHVEDNFTEGMNERFKNSIKDSDNDEVLEIVVKKGNEDVGTAKIHWRNSTETGSMVTLFSSELAKSDKPMPVKDGSPLVGGRRSLRMPTESAPEPDEPKDAPPGLITGWRR